MRDATTRACKAVAGAMAASTSEAALERIRIEWTLLPGSSAFDPSTEASVGHLATEDRYADTRYSISRARVFADSWASAVGDTATPSDSISAVELTS